MMESQRERARAAYKGADAAARADAYRTLLAGVVVSHTEPDLSDADRANLAHLLDRLPAPCLGELAHGAEAVAPPFDLAALLSPSGTR